MGLGQEAPATVLHALPLWGDPPSHTEFIRCLNDFGQSRVPATQRILVLAFLELLSPSLAEFWTLRAKVLSVFRATVKRDENPPSDFSVLDRNKFYAARCAQTLIDVGRLAFESLETPFGRWFEAILSIALSSNKSLDVEQVVQYLSLETYETLWQRTQQNARCDAMMRSLELLREQISPRST